MASYVVAAAIFLVGSTYLLHFVVEPPGGTGDDLAHAALRSTASDALAILLGSRGYPLAWDATATSIDQDLQRLGLIEPGASIRVDPTKFDALAKGRYATASPTNGYVDYAEAKDALGLSGYDFHLRGFPAMTSDDGAYGTAGMDAYRIAYVGDFTGATRNAPAQLEPAAIDALDVGFVNSTRSGLVTSGDVYEDDASVLRQYLVPLIGSGVRQVAISEGSGLKYDFQRVNASALTGVLSSQGSLTSALALTKDGTTLGYTKGREVRASLGVANMSSLTTAVLTWKEWVDSDRGNGSYDPGDYGFMELSADNGLTWCRPTSLVYTASQDVLSSAWTPAYRTRLLVVDDSVCPGIEGNANVLVAAHWVGDGDNSIGYGWVLDDVKIEPTSATGFDRTFESPEYDLLIMGSNVDQTAFTPDDVKNAIRDYVDVYGGRIIVLGGETNTQWLQPLFHVGIEGASPGVATPDATHPLLTVPNELDWSSYDHGGKAWDFSGSGDENLFNMVVGTNSNQHVLSVSSQGAFGDGTGDGVVMLTTYLPFNSGSAAERMRFFANAVTYGKFHYLYLEVGPEVPENVPVASVTRSATMNKMREGTPEYVEMSFILYVWQGSTTAQTLAATSVVPTPPQALSTAFSAQNVWVNWSAPDSWGTGSAKYYHVYRGHAPGYLTTRVANVSSAITSWLDTNVSYGTTYYYNVTAISSSGNGTASDEVAATPITTPGAPTGLATSPGLNEVILGWSAPASTGGSAVSAYAIYVNNTAGNGYDLLAEIGNTTSYVHSTLAPETYTYKVAAGNGAGYGANSTTATGQVISAPLPPASLAVTAATPNNLTLAWTPPASTGSALLSGYKVFRSPDEATWETLATLNNAANVSFVDVGLGTNVTRYYRVAAVTDVGDGANSTTGWAKTMAAPDTPAYASATTVPIVGVVLTWVAPASDAPITHYEMWRGASEGATTVSLGTTALTTYTDTGGATGDWYLVRAVSAAGSSDGATVQAPLAAPSAPQSFSISNASAGPSNLSLSWLAPASSGSEPIEGYKVFRSTDNVTWTTLYTSTNELNTSYVDTFVGNNTTRYYRVAAYSSVGDGLNTTTLSKKTVGAPYPPAGFAATRVATTTTLAWSAAYSEASVIRYEVYKGGTSSSAGTTLVCSTALLTCTDTGGSSNTWYAVRAISAAGTGNWAYKQSN